MKIILQLLSKQLNKLSKKQFRFLPEEGNEVFVVDSPFLYAICWLNNFPPKFCENEKSFDLVMPHH